MENETLSDDIELARQSGYNEACFVAEKKFREFINKLKETTRICLQPTFPPIAIYNFIREIDKLVGEELIK